MDTAEKQKKLCPIEGEIDVKQALEDLFVPRVGEIYRVGGYIVKVLSVRLAEVNLVGRFECLNADYTFRPLSTSMSWWITNVRLGNFRQISSSEWKT